MKKRIARIVVYFLLAGVTVLVISHPYVWQSIFRPKDQRRAAVGVAGGISQPQVG